MVGGGIDPTKIPTGMEGPGRKAHNPGPGWVTEHAGKIFLFAAGIGFLGLAIVFIVSVLTGDD